MATKLAPGLYKEDFGPFEIRAERDNDVWFPELWFRDSLLSNPIPVGTKGRAIRKMKALAKNFTADAVSTLQASRN